MLDNASLTSRLRGFCRGEFSVQVISQQSSPPLYDERVALGMCRAESSLIREVFLCCDAIPFVFARTIIPARTLRGGGRRLARLGSRPLGALLFADPKAGRESMQVASLNSRHILYHKALQGAEKSSPLLWARRTRFSYYSSPLLVNEIFLPELFRDPSACYF